ncbi:unnamed protein product [Rotaria sp. Silwood1]|nr:unnamed protein product [Rotaria sp. Silwood1]CAF3593284.1 unnamed protein product [Rotaria sp. Silwood1]CAF3658395.1 unnamed protein product [Rotaria sp. Silwood1]CAF3708425.1 unnamed protein product [Rotaria sp. Silwood1]CAF4541951.1 unnamed protein product [Rotaria sp. Silwood1]
MTIHFHPEWLTVIPENRKWAILHHIVYSGNIDHLDQVLASQKSNKDFRLLSKTTEGETVLDIAKSRDDLSDMLKHIERLVKLDELLNYAKERNWNKCYEIVKEDPRLGNEKPPYRLFYLIHQLAYADEVEQFKKFQELENFKFDLTLRVDRKKINDIAREGKGEKFAQYIEKTYPSFFNTDNTNDKLYEPSKQAKEHTNNINALIEQRNVFDESSFSFGPAQNLLTRKEADKKVKPKLVSPSPTTGTMKPLQQPIDAILSFLTCSLTQAIVKDPVVAADGFTYERTAIEKWLQSNDRSPMTNEKLAHINLNPNLIVKRILDSFSQ